MSSQRRCWLFALALLSLISDLRAASVPASARNGMVVSQDAIASQVGLEVLRQGGNAVDAAVATAFALAVTHPAAGNIGGGGFLLYRSNSGEAAAYDFRETAPARASATMFLREGNYDAQLHHHSHVSVGVPGTVAGLHLAWKEHGRLSWKRLIAPAIQLAMDGFAVSPGLAQSLASALPMLRQHPASLAQFSRQGAALQAGQRLRQPDLARTLERIARLGPAGFYDGETAELIEREMRTHGGLITREDLRAYRAKERQPIRGTYRGVEILGMPPPSSGGIALVETLNLLEGFDLKTPGYHSAAGMHQVVESLRRSFADRARYLGDPDSSTVPVERLTSKAYARELRRGIRFGSASVSEPARFEWPTEGDHTTHLSVVDEARNAVALTYTLEESYGSGIVVPGGGFLLNNEMGDFNAAPGLTTTNGLIGTEANLAAPGKRMLSSMSPTILAKDGNLLLVTGSPGGRTIISTVLMTILNVVDFGMNAQEAVDAPRFHHQWLPDRVAYERHGFSPDTLKLLKSLGHNLEEISSQGAAQVIRVRPQDGWLEGGADRRAPDSKAAGF